MARNKAYQAAEEKVAKALRSGATELDLDVGYGESDLEKLTELPESLGQLTQLQSLNCGNNRLTTLPDWLGQLTQLESLDVSGNQLTTLPNWLGHLTQLESLDVSHNQLTTLPRLAHLTQLESLDVSNNQLTTLPEWLGHLTQLESLNVSGNKLNTLPEFLNTLKSLQELSASGIETFPEWLGQLKNLRKLWVIHGRIERLPESISNLANLEVLELEFNQLTELPRSIGQLNRLKELDLRGNRLKTLPDSVSELLNLKELWLGSEPIGNPLGIIPSCIRGCKKLEVLGALKCGLSSLPDWLGELINLEILYVDGNSITDLPQSLAQLNSLSEFHIANNPLNPELAVAYKEGLDGVKRYLRELEKGGQNRYEAKLLILGDGNEGKTCVSRALRNLPFRDQKTTRGVDIVQWKFPHPDDTANQEKEITLNIWDFEGQEISHQTHQFFLTSQALYVLVFKCRDQFLIDRAEYWLDTIRARAPQAKVVIVISQCEERSPHIPLDRIEAQYRDLLAREWFFAVGCKNGKSISELQSFLRRSAAELEFMGTPWPKSYEKAESTIKARVKKSTSHITRSNLNGILRKAGVNEDNFDGAAGSLARIGALTQFPDCVDLRDFVVLRPQWLTKAISKVMEDDQLSDDKGEIALRRMESIWNKARYSGMFSTFHNCMKEFELCYDLEDQDDSCLVPLRFGYVAPTIPWTEGPDLKVRRVEYKLNLRPPMGIMSRFIVKTHHMIVKTTEYPKGVYWHNGVFLRTNSPFPSEALVEFVPEDRTFRIEVRAAYPQNMCEQIHAYIEAVFVFFRGLSAERSYGCIKVDSQTGVEHKCSGLHTEKRIYAELSQQRTLRCEFEDHDVEPLRLVWGFNSFNEFVTAKFLAQVRRELDRPPEWATPFLRGIGTLLDWVNTNRQKLDELLRGQAELSAEFKQETELKFHEYLGRMSQLLDDREQTAAPGLISVSTKDRSVWNPTRYFTQTYMLTPYCEWPGNIHACEDGQVEFTRDKAWWHKTAPWIARSTKLLAAGLQLGFAGMPLVVGADVMKIIEDDVKFMEALTKHLELEVPKQEKDSGAEMLEDAASKDLRGTDRESAIMRAALARFLEETAPNNYRAQRWGSLRRVLMSDNTHRWLCDQCAKRSR